MRCELAAIVIALAAGCAPKVTGERVCHPVSSWAAPVYDCEAPVAEAPKVVEPTPEPTPQPAPPPEPDEQIELKEQVQFKTDSAELLPVSLPVLDDVVKTMKDHPEIKKVRIEGHTDSTSTPEHNQKLSEDRAASVKAYLVKKGIAEDRLTSQGFGQDKPIDDNGTEEGRAKNRRVEIHIVEKTKK